MAKITSVIDDNELTFRYANETAKDIADDIGFSISTVRRYLRHIGVTKKYAKEYYKEYISDKEEAKRNMIDAFYKWAIGAKVRGEYKVIRKILDNLEKENISIEDDGTYQLSTGNYAIDETHKKILVKIRLPPSQKKMEIYFREKKRV